MAQDETTPNDEVDRRSGADSAPDDSAAPGLGSDGPGDPPVVLPITDVLDLHSFPPDEVRDVVTEYLNAAHGSGFRALRIIHGRGTGVQRRSVRSLLAHHPLVASFHDAPAEAGGWGATLVELKRAGG